MTDGYSLPACSAAKFFTSATSTLPTSFSDDNWMRMAGKQVLNDKCNDQYSGETGCNAKVFNEDTRGIPEHAQEEGVKGSNQKSEKGDHHGASKREIDGNSSFNQSSSKNGEPIWVNVDSKARIKTDKYVESESEGGHTVLNIEDDKSSDLSSCGSNGVFRMWPWVHVLCLVILILVITSIGYCYLSST
jgi:hypothetical protein